MESQKSAFRHRVSKGSRFNQIYIPTDMTEIFEVGDLVEIKLVMKKERVYYSESLKKLGKISEFKENVIKQIFSLLEKFKEIKQAFVVGSFLTEKADYKDIDIILVSSEKNIEEKAYNYISEKMQMKFHVISIPEQKFLELLKICPLTRSMLYYSASNKKFSLSKETEIDKKHIQFLLMMPEDLLKLDLPGGRAYFDALRRLIALRNFLAEKEVDPAKINEELKKVLGENYSMLKGNEIIDKKTLKIIRDILKSELSEANKLLKNADN